MGESFVPQVRCSIPERRVCELESGDNNDGWRRVTNVEKAGL